MRILLTGATGFVGSYLLPALEAAGHTVVCASRDPEAARRAHPAQHWVFMDVEDLESTKAALDDCDAAYYLIHGIGQSVNYPEREAASAKNFVEAADQCKVGRIVYLGGVIPMVGKASKHLRSRQTTGELLRSGQVSTLEIRAAMIIGHGSISWTMVKDLAARLPAMLLPRWLKNTSYPVAIDDVIWSLLAALHYPGGESFVFEIPGPERITHRDVLQRVAQLLGHTRPMFNVPVLSPRLSSYWIALVTRVDLSMAKELVEGVRYNLDPSQTILWDKVEHEPMRLEAAAKQALADAESGQEEIHARMRLIGTTLKQDLAWLANAAQ